MLRSRFAYSFVLHEKHTERRFCREWIHYTVYTGVGLCIFKHSVFLLLFFCKKRVFSCSPFQLCWIWDFLSGSRLPTCFSNDSHVRQLGSAMIATFRQLGSAMIATFRQLGSAMIATFRQLGSAMIATFRQLGSAIIATFRQLGSAMIATFVS